MHSIVRATPLRTARGRRSISLIRGVYFERHELVSLNAPSLAQKSQDAQVLGAEAEAAVEAKGQAEVACRGAGYGAAGRGEMHSPRRPEQQG